MELRTAAPLNSLPTVIDGPGHYLTRDGKKATIYSVSEPNEDPTVTSCRAKGAVWKMFRGKLTPRGYGIWHVSGRKYTFGEFASDIVSVWQD